MLRPLGSAYFLYSILAHKDIRNWVQLAGSSRKKLVQKSMLNIELIMPKLKEQQKIGNYFRNLDHLITLHQRQLNNLKKLKKICLKKMMYENNTKEKEIMPELESMIEQKLIEQLIYGDSQWTYRGDLKTEADLVGEFPIYS